MTLVLAAVNEELGDLPGDVVGVGPVVAGVRAAGILRRDLPDRVVLIGTAGAYASGPPIGTVIVASKLGFGLPVDLLGAGYTPLPPAPIDADPALVEAAGVRACRVLTVPSITTDPGLVARLGEGWEIEHLEAYAVAVACRELGVPFTAILGVTNRVGPAAHAEWVANREAVQQATREVVASTLLGRR